MKMENIRIEAQVSYEYKQMFGQLHTIKHNRFCYDGKKKVELFNVVADSERFGENEIMYQGPFKDCVAYLAREGYDYKAIVLEQNRGRDIQITHRMFRIISQVGAVLHLQGRAGQEMDISTDDLIPVAPYTFRLPENPFASPMYRKGSTASVKIGPARAW